MSLSTNITLTVSDYDIKLSRNLKFYEHDQLKLIFNLNYWGIDNANGVTQKVLMPLNALSAILFIETPLGVDSIESATIEENVVTFYLTSNQTQHIGVSRMQIQLSDADGCQITLPPMEFEVRENIYDDEVILSQVLLADEDENIVVDENGNAVNTGTQVSTQTYAIALSAEDETTATTSQPTKQIKDFNLKNGVSGEEDLLIQDSDGVTKRIKTSEFLNVDIDLTLYYTKEEIDTLLNNKADISHTHTTSDITDLVIPTVDVDKNYVDTQLSMKANIEDIPTVPTKTSELINDIGFITTIPSEYITENELNTELSTKANISDIPSLDGYATETFVTNKIAEASLGGGGEVDLSGYATKDDLSTKADVSHSHTTDDINGLSTVATSGSYNDLIDKPTIPIVDVDKSYVDTQLATKANVSDIPNLDGYALKTEIPTVPTKTSELTNDSGFINSIPSEYVTETELNAKGYLTEHIDISGKANISDLATVATSGDYNDLLNKPTVTNGVDGKSAYEIYVENTTETPLTEIEWLSSLKGADGEQGIQGENGATFTPNVDTDGNLSWTNDKELENPTTINIKGAKGDKGEQGEKGADGKDGQDGLTTSISLNGTVYSHVDGTITLPDYPTIPTKTSDLINDSEFLTSIPTEYITEAKLNEKGYLTEHQDISGKANISDLSAVATSGNYNDLINKPTIPSIDGLATETYVNNKIIPNLVGNTVTNKTLTLTVDKYQYAVLSNGDSVVLPSVSSFTEIHLFFKASADLTLTFPSVRWQSIPSITSGHTYEIIFTYVVDEWLAGVICYE